MSFNSKRSRHEVTDAESFCQEQLHPAVIEFLRDLLKMYSKLFIKYGAVGKVRIFEGIPESCVVVPSSYGGSRRKPTTTYFQQFADRVVLPVMLALFFGSTRGLAHKHLSSLKINSLQLSDQPENVYHMHLDGKPNVLNPKDVTQKHITRMLCSIYSRSHGTADNGTTVYLNKDLHSSAPFTSVKGFHVWMQKNFPERGLSEGKSRPLYELRPDQIHRLKEGEIGIHPSHTIGCSQIIHSEPNPKIPRYALIWDFVNLPGPKHPQTGKPTCIPIPEDKLLELMKPICVNSLYMDMVNRIKLATQVLIETNTAFCQ